VSRRVGFWIGGVVLGVALASSVPEHLFPGARPAVWGFAFLAMGLFGEFLHAARVRKQASAVTERRDPRPADGQVELARVHGFLGEPNPFDPRFLRFQGRANGEQPLVDPDDASGPSCPPLLGRVVIASLFLGRDGRTWSESELADALEAVFRAAAWVEREAQRYGARVNLELADVYFVADDDEPDGVALGLALQGEGLGLFEEDATPKALLRATRAAAGFGFRDAVELFRTVADRVNADTTVWLLHPRESGRSFAIPHEVRAPGGLSLAVCYPDFASFPEPLIGPAYADAVTIAHELLHLFGATDKYGRPLKAYAPQTVTAREIMRLSERRLSRLRVDWRTAAEIGWVDFRKPAAKTERPA